MSGLFDDSGDINFLAIIDLNCDAVSVAAWTQHRLLGVLFHFLAVKHLQIHIFEMPFVDESCLKFRNGFGHLFFLKKANRRHKISHLKQTIEFRFNIVMKKIGERSIRKCEV